MNCAQESSPEGDRGGQAFKPSTPSTRQGKTKAKAKAKTKAAAPADAVAAKKPSALQSRGMRKAFRMTIALLASGSLMALVLTACILFSPRPPLLEGVAFSTPILDANGALLNLPLARDREVFRLRTPLSSVSPEMIRATLLYEDQWFAYHPGVNPVALTRAFGNALFGEGRAGASTITMQVARLRFGLKTRSVAGKLTQILRALQIERHYSKEEILEAYLNLAPYGGNIEGVGAASLIYFGKSAHDLTLREVVALAVLPQSPDRRRPKRDFTRMAGAKTATSSPADGATIATDTLVDRADLNAPEGAAARARLWGRWHAGADGPPGLAKDAPPNPLAALGAPRDSMPLAWKTRAALPFLAPHFCTMLLAEEDAAAKRGEAAKRTAAASDLPASGPVLMTPDEIRSTLRLEDQALMEKQIREYLSMRQSEGLRNASAVLLDTRSMEVRGWVGSADFRDASIAGQVDGVTMHRSPGSALKPFVYGLAIDQGLIHPLSLLEDGPTNFGDYNPENIDHQFFGPIAAGRALVFSRNVPAVTLNNRLTGTTLYDVLERGGVPLKAPGYYGLTLALGGVEISPLELAQMYAMLANRGVWRPARTRLGADSDVRESRRMMRPEAAFLVLDILRGNPRPKAIATSGWGRAEAPVAWKTGTSFGGHDAWSAGIFDHYTLVVWVGNFDNESNRRFEGRTAAGPIFFQIVEALRARDGREEMRRVRLAGGSAAGPNAGEGMGEKTTATGKAELIRTSFNSPASTAPSSGNVVTGHPETVEIGHDVEANGAPLAAGNQGFPASRQAPASAAAKGASHEESQSAWWDPTGLNVQRERICPVSGALAGPNCHDVVEGWFIPGVSPISPCSVHQLIVVDGTTGLRVPSMSSVVKAHEEVVEMWPAHLLDLFRRAGSPRREPPRWAPGFGDNASSAGGVAVSANVEEARTGMAILSPPEGSVFTISRGSGGGGGEQTVALRVAVPAGVQRIFWFADNRLLGSTGPSEPLWWKPTAGSITLRAVDDRGRAAERNVTIHVQ